MRRTPYNGLAILSFAARPFLQPAIVFTTGVAPVRWMVWQGRLTLGSSFQPCFWIGCLCGADEHLRERKNVWQLSEFY